MDDGTLAGYDAQPQRPAPLQAASVAIATVSWAAHAQQAAAVAEFALHCSSQDGRARESSCSLVHIVAIGLGSERKRFCPQDVRGLRLG